MMPTTRLSGTEPDQTDIWGIEKQLASGEGAVFKGAPNIGVPAGPERSPQLPAALKEI